MKRSSPRYVGIPSPRFRAIAYSILACSFLVFASCSAGPAPRVPTSPESKAVGGAEGGTAEPAKPAAPLAEASASGKADAKTAKDGAAMGGPAEDSAPVTRSAPSDGYGAVSTMAPRVAAPSASGLKAGFSDDNGQFNYFTDFLEKYGDARHYDFPIAERITLKVSDSSGKPVPNARVRVRSGGRTLEEGLTYPDGGFRIYPLSYRSANAAGAGSREASYEVSVDSGSMRSALTVERAGPRTVEIRLQGRRAVPAPVPLDVLFVMDTTGSMGEEIERLRATIEIIYANLAELKPRPAIRFGLVLYRDEGDEYVTRVVKFTGSLDAFQRSLDMVEADGGGDGPEDLQAALDDAVRKMDWNDGGIRMGFIVTDAEPHLDYGREYTYIDAARDAKAKAVKLFSIGTGGLPIEGEYVLRQLSQITDARYIFLTYGEGGESGGGTEGSVSHHTGANFQTDKLEAIVIRFVKEEVAMLSDVPVEAPDDYFAAARVADETKDQTLDKLFEEALRNLSDYSSFRIGADTACAVMPLAAAAKADERTAEYFGERLLLAAAKAKTWKLVERKDLQKILSELELQLSGLADEGAAKVGSMLGAEVLVGGTLVKRGEGYELFLKLLRVSTGEVLAVTRAKLAADLGL